MKPYELIAALMHKEKLGALPLAKRMNKASLQPQIHRYITGQVANPARTPAVPLAAYFKVPVDAIYDEKLATAIAKERGVEALPPKVAATRRNAKARPTAVDFTPEEVAMVLRHRAKKARREQAKVVPINGPGSDREPKMPSEFIKFTDQTADPKGSKKTPGGKK